MVAVPYWRVNEEESGAAWATFEGRDEVFDADVKWDGCINLFFTVRVSADDYSTAKMHICDLDDFIAKLQELKYHATDYFGDSEWPACAPNYSKDKVSREQNNAAPYPPERAGGSTS